MKPNVLLVDDEHEILMAYQRNLFKIFKVHVATSGLEALEVIRTEGPFAAVLSDYNMPGMNGIDFLSKVKDLSPDTTRIIITGYADVSVAISAVNNGKVFRFLTKPISMDNLITVMNAAVHQYKLINSEKELLDKTLKGSIKILIDLLSILQPEIFSRTNRYRILSRKIAEKLQNVNIWEAEMAGLLSEIGSLIMPTDILAKYSSSDEIDETEQTFISKIPSYSADILKNIPRLETIAEAISHSDLDFTPVKATDTNLSGEELPILSRILKIVKDYFKFHSETNNNNETYNLLLTNKRKYDPTVLRALVDIINSDKGPRKKVVYLRELRTGMVLAENLEGEGNLVLISKGKELSDVLIMKLGLISKRVEIKEPIFIYEQ